jgi:hypothetical protein
MHVTSFLFMQDLAKLPEARRKEVLGGCGVPASAVADIDKTLSTLPHIHITAVKVFVDGEEDIKEGDMITIQIFVVLTRACHAHASMLPLLGCAAAQAHTPRFPHVVKEKWCELVTLDVVTCSIRMLVEAVLWIDVLFSKDRAPCALEHLELRVQ